ncbi:hypothetical protein Pelo_10179 [Pelomyxa schiedti]|nr:hypothetical protein Pelo_10179 [Pelomyxa schiedti]
MDPVLLGLPLILLLNRLDWTDPVRLFYLRCAYGAMQILNMIVFGVVYCLIHRKADKTEVVVPGKDSLGMLTGQQTKTTVEAYDSGELMRSVKEFVLMTPVMLFVSLKWHINTIFVSQTLFVPLKLATNKLVQSHILGWTYPRPFPVPENALMKLLGLGSAAAPATPAATPAAPVTPAVEATSNSDDSYESSSEEETEDKTKEEKEVEEETEKKEEEEEEKEAEEEKEEEKEEEEEEKAEAEEEEEKEEPEPEPEPEEEEEEPEPEPEEEEEKETKPKKSRGKKKAKKASTTTTTTSPTPAATPTTTSSLTKRKNNKKRGKKQD